jgi:methoxymalonate biosynthesis acyl carrier protein
MTQYLTEVRTYLSGHLDGRAPDDDEDLYDNGYLNSLFAVQIVMWIEREYGLPVGGPDLVLDNFRSVASIARFISDRSGN